MASPVVLRQKASDDVDELVAYYLSEAGGDVAHQFIETLEEVIGELGRQPLVGSLRYSYELDLPEVRSWPIRGFPYIAFGVARPDVVDVWRVLHAQARSAYMTAAPRARGVNGSPMFTRTGHARDK